MDVVTAYHERTKRMGEAMSAKAKARELVRRRLDGMQSLVQERKWDEEDIEWAGTALLSMMAKHPGLDQEVVMDLVAELANVDESTVTAALWEQTDIGRIKLEPGMHFVLADDAPAVG